MDKVFASSATLGAVFSLGAFWLGCAIQKRFRLAILNPLLIAMAIVAWPSITRLVRGQFLSLRESEFVLAARSIGADEKRIIFKHILPNSLNPIIVAVTLGIPATIFREAGLSFIGIGIVPPTPSWGQMVGSYYMSIQAYWWQSVCPALTLALAILGFTLLSNGLQDALTPKSSKG